MLIFVDLGNNVDKFEIPLVKSSKIYGIESELIILRINDLIFEAKWTVNSFLEGLLINIEEEGINRNFQLINRNLISKEFGNNFFQTPQKFSGRKYLKIFKAPPIIY